jgi:hypothetical protein
MAEITEDQPHYNTLSTIVRNLEEKDTLPITPTENASILPHHCYRGLQKGFMNTAIDNYFNSSYTKHGFFLPKRENISQRVAKFWP